MAFPVTAAEAFVTISWLVALGWLWQAVTALWGVRQLPDLTKIEGILPLLPPNDGPQISVIVPARNEEETIQSTLLSLLASEGIRLQIIVVNDRSADRTGERMEEVSKEATAAGGRHSLEVQHICALPAGWLGKPHAMAQAAQRATAPWILFTDGDVLFQPHALELALREAKATKADHMILIPSLILHTTGERAMLAAMQALSQWAVRLWKVADPGTRDFLGVGGFNLIRREVYEQLGGFASLRMEVLDDLRLGWKVKRGGFAQRVALGPGLVRIRWLHGALAVVRLVEKNGFAVCRFRTILMLLTCLGIAMQSVWPLLALAAGGWSSMAGLATYVGITSVYAANRRVAQVGPWAALFFAPAAALIAFAFLRSMLLALVRDGIVWRGTHYPLAELRRHAGPIW